MEPICRLDEQEQVFLHLFELLYPHPENELTEPISNHLIM